MIISSDTVIDSSVTDDAKAGDEIMEGDDTDGHMEDSDMG